MQGTSHANQQVTSFLNRQGTMDDYDFILLEEARKHRVVCSNSSLQLNEEQPSSSVFPSGMSVENPNRSDTNEMQIREQLFDLVYQGSLDHLKTKIDSLPDQTSLASNIFRHPKTNQNLLQFALEIKNRNIAQMLIEYSNVFLDQDYNTSIDTTEGKRNCFHQIIEANDLEMMNQLIEMVSSKDLLMKCLLQETPVEVPGQIPRRLRCVHLAAFYGYTEMTELLLKCGVKVNHTNARKDTALLWAAHQGHEDTVVMLLKHEADANLENVEGLTPLYVAVRCGHTRIVALLTERGNADVNKTRNVGLVAPISTTSALGLIDIVKLLLKQNVNPNVCGRDGKRPIHHAASEGYHDIVQILLSNDAHIDETDQYGDTALIMASKCEHIHVLQTLIQNDANINHKNNEGADVWTFAIRNEKDEMLRVLINTLLQTKAIILDKVQHVIRFGKIQSLLFEASAEGACSKIKLLLQMNVNPAARDEQGNTFLHYAAMYNRDEVVKMFCDKIGPDEKNKSGNTPLHISTSKGHPETVFALLEKNAKFNIKNSRGANVLHVAACSKDIKSETVVKLFQHAKETVDSESINAEDNEQNNPLHLAAKFAKPDIIWEFRYVSLKGKNYKGNTPLHVAVRPGEPEVLDMMLNIYENICSDSVINTRNIEGKSVLHLAALEGCT
ncbi:ankyrin-3-like [Gigantopelta aegis]|uniref:ankyrin-3-like n=1 Tax=Gigantopelta aegis TaxID=1735272 RepID=UPI001B88D685|nr:ankyrin-3-like [Gigantopelta aegis]